MKKTSVLIAAATLTGALSFGAHADAVQGQDAPKTWNLIETNPNGAVIAVIQGLTKHACDFAKDRALGLPATPQEVTAQQNLEQKALTADKAWAAKHHCNGWGGTSTNSFVASDGSCFIGPDVDPSDTESAPVQTDGAVQKAECFQ